VICKFRRVLHRSLLTFYMLIYHHANNNNNNNIQQRQQLMRQQKVSVNLYRFVCVYFASTGCVLISLNQSLALGQEEKKRDRIVCVCFSIDSKNWQWIIRKTNHFAFFLSIEHHLFTKCLRDYEKKRE